MRNSVLREVASAAILLAATGLARAQDRKPNVDVNCDAGVTSNYVVAGISQNRDRPTLMGSCDVQHEHSGLYGTVFTARGVDPQLYNGSRQEVDANFGLRKKIGPGTADFAYESFLYPGQNGKVDNNDTRRVAAKYSVKGLMARYSLTTTELFGISGSRGTSRVDVNYTRPLTKKFSFTAGGGHLAVQGPSHSFSYFDASAHYKLMKGLSVEAGYAGRDGDLTYSVGNGKNFNAARPRARFGLDYSWGFRR